MPTTASSTPFAACAEEVRRLYASAGELERAGNVLAIAPLSGREWFETLSRKLLPQLVDEPFLVAAVVGGTNIGKSVVFNHLAGCRASATSPLASGTKHPVCLVPAGFTERHNLAVVFPGFELHSWETAEAALEDRTDDCIFWRESEFLPGNLLVLDTPDIDSDAVVNWRRADCIRHCADVLIAVLTQQKYNDAAVKQFFRKAAAEDKAILVVFNQCLLPEDEAYWPLWLATFSRETGISPDLVYLAPNDRRAAEENRLPFLRRDAEGRGEAASERASDLRKDLSEMHFVEIKMRTLRGSLTQVLTGVPEYLAEIERTSAAFRGAADLLSTQQLARVDNWPAPPPRELVAEIRRWWHAQRQGFTRTIHTVYGTVGEGLTWPFRWMKRKITGDAPDPRETYRRQEWDAIVLAVNELYDELTRLSQLGNDLLRPRLERLLAGATRSELIDKLSREHAALDLDAELQSVVQTQMQSFRGDSPNLFALFKRLDSLAAMARPVTSVVLFVAAAGPVGHAIAPMVTDAAAQSVVIHVVGDIAGGTGAVVVGETALTGTAGGLRHLEAKFQQLQTAFTARRVAWFAEFLKRNLLGELQEELRVAADVPRSLAFQNVRASVAKLGTLFQDQRG